MFSLNRNIPVETKPLSATEVAAFVHAHLKTEPKT
jgi:hypothetical protein